MEAETCSNMLKHQQPNKTNRTPKKPEVILLTIQSRLRDNKERHMTHCHNKHTHTNMIKYVYNLYTQYIIDHPTCCFSCIVNRLRLKPLAVGSDQGGLLSDVQELSSLAPTTPTPWAQRLPQRLPPPHPHCLASPEPETQLSRNGLCQYIHPAGLHAVQSRNDLQLPLNSGESTCAKKLNMAQKAQDHAGVGSKCTRIDMNWLETSPQKSIRQFAKWMHGMHGTST